MRKLTSNHIAVLLHYYILPDRHPSENAPAIERVLEDFVNDEILSKESDFPSGYLVTDKGLKFIHMILETPYPVKKWIAPEKGKQI